MASVLNFLRAHLHFLRQAIRRMPSPADLTWLLSYEWIEIETVACLAGFCDKNRPRAGPAVAALGFHLVHV
jgi:hypothetical protein